MNYVMACVPDDPAVREQISKIVGKPCVPYKDSVPGACAHCECKVWLGPEQEVKRVELTGKGESVTVLCEPCATAVMLATGVSKVQPLSQKRWGE